MAAPELKKTKTGVQTHRGLRRSDIVARTEIERGLRWALFKRGAWPPAVWNVPAALEGVALLQMIEERSVMYVPAWKVAKRRGNLRKGMKEQGND